MAKEKEFEIGIVYANRHGDYFVAVSEKELARPSEYGVISFDCSYSMNSYRPLRKLEIKELLPAWGVSNKEMDKQLGPFFMPSPEGRENKNNQEIKELMDA